MMKTEIVESIESWASASACTSALQVLPKSPLYHRKLSACEKEVLAAIAACSKREFGFTQTGTSAHESAERLRVLGLIECVEDSATGTFWRAKYAELAEEQNERIEWLCYAAEGCYHVS